MLLEILLVIIVALFLLYRYVTKHFNKWESLGVPHDKPSFPCGTHNLFDGRHFQDHVSEGYEKYKNEKVYGWYMFGQPVLAINDIDLVKTIKVKDFNHFVDTQNEHMSKTQLIGGDLDTLFNSHLGTAKEGEWRDIRSSFSPIFTSGRMKGMMK